MISFCRNLLIACCLLCGVFFVFGFIRGDRMRMSYREEKRQFILVVSVPDITERYDTLIVQSCAAAITEAGVFCLEDGQETSSYQAIRVDQKQYPIPFPPVRVTTMFAAAAVDRQHTTLASDRLIVMRAY